MKTKNPHPPAPSPKFGRRGAGKKSLSQVGGEGFRVRAKTTVLNIDEVYFGCGSIERLVLSAVVGAASRREASRDAQYKSVTTVGIAFDFYIILSLPHGSCYNALNPCNALPSLLPLPTSVDCHRR